MSKCIPLENLIKSFVDADPSNAALLQDATIELLREQLTAANERIAALEAALAEALAALDSERLAVKKWDKVGADRDDLNLAQQLFDDAQQHEKNARQALAPPAEPAPGAREAGR